MRIGRRRYHVKKHTPICTSTLRVIRRLWGDGKNQLLVNAIHVMMTMLVTLETTRDDLKIYPTIDLPTNVTIPPALWASVV
eukprot:9495422-Pyramimonas_sp.AAC.1